MKNINKKIRKFGLPHHGNARLFRPVRICVDWSRKFQSTVLAIERDRARDGYSLVALSRSVDWICRTFLNQR